MEGDNIRFTEETAIFPYVHESKPSANLSRQENSWVHGGVCSLWHRVSQYCKLPLPFVGGTGLFDTEFHLRQSSDSHSPSPSSFIRVLNLFLNCKFSGGAGAFFLVPKASSLCHHDSLHYPI